MGRLILLNGAPGVGKSAVAHRYLEDHPLALLIDIDGIRTLLGRWEQLEESKLIARTLAIALVKQQLADGRDVIVPQYLGRRDFITTLETVSGDGGAEFVAVWLDAPPMVAAARFRARRAELLASNECHPQMEVPEDAVEEAIQDAVTQLAALAVKLGDAIRINANQPVENVYEEIVMALRERQS